MKLTIFTTPKAFREHIGIIQRNAITSWTRLIPRPNIVIFGDEPGTAELCDELGLLHVPDIASTATGTPLISSMFATAQEGAPDESLMCFINSDIILTSSVMRAVDRVDAWGLPFLMVGRRYELDITEPIEFDSDNWEVALTRRVENHRVTLGDFYIDWFVFRRGALHDLPPFAVGRPGYDNWLLWHAEDIGLQLVDATAASPVFHQRHEYLGGRRKVWTAADSLANLAMLGHWSHKYTIAHARWRLNSAGDVVRAQSPRYRLARPMVLAGHLMRFTRPIRGWIADGPRSFG